MNKKLMLTLVAAVLIGVMVAVPQPVKATTYEVDIQNFTYTPGNMHIQVGDAIEWTNRDNVSHTTTSDTGVWDSGFLSLDDTYTFTFTEVGTFPYHCTVHPSMRDTIFVESQTSIGDQSRSIPNKIELAQNYPNPFNARTEITYTLAQASHVKITVYNIIGQAIATLVNQGQAAGEYRVNWDAANQPTGVYFYRLQAGNISQSRRMVLLK